MRIIGHWFIEVGTFVFFIDLLQIYHFSSFVSFIILFILFCDIILYFSIISYLENNSNIRVIVNKKVKECSGGELIMFVYTTTNRRASKLTNDRNYRGMNMKDRNRQTQRNIRTNNKYYHQIAT